MAFSSLEGLMQVYECFLKKAKRFEIRIKIRPSLLETKNEISRHV